jgi:hypothetical protein
MKSYFSGRYFHVAIIAFSLVVLVAWYFLTGTEPASNVSESPGFSVSDTKRTGPAERRSMKVISAAEAIRGNAGASPASSERARELERLKQKWLEIGSGDHDIDRRDALAEESALKLSFSLELLELADFLRERGILAGGNAGSDLELVASLSLSSDNAGEARQLLIEVVGKDIPKDVMHEWCYSAGRSCPPEEFQAFLDALSAVSIEAASIARLGRARETLQSEPVATIASAMDALENIPSESSRLSNLLETLPPSADFEAIAGMLHEKDPDGTRFKYARDAFFRNWADFHSAGAANHVLANAQNYPIELISLIASRANPDDAIEWIGYFPRGAYRDAAAAGLAKGHGLSNSVKAREIAAVIEDPKVRAEAIKSIEASERTVRSGEKY